MRSRVVERIRDLPASEWNALDHRGYPFLRHEFLSALEGSGCIGFETGWRPYSHRQPGRVCCIAPTRR
jgi:predicted N-acyltransferase